MKSTGITYLLWFFFGGFGAHKFYLGRPWIGALYICMAVVFWIGLVGLLAHATDDLVKTVSLAMRQGTDFTPRSP